MALSASRSRSGIAQSFFPLVRISLKWMVFVILFLALLAPSLTVPALPARGAVGNPNQLLYPQGSIFPLVLYSVADGEMATTSACGFNMVQTYDYTPDYLTSAKQANLYAMGNLPPYTDPEQIRSGPITDAGKTILDQSALSPRMAWWNFPEELRWWEDSEKQLYVDYSQLTRQRDPKQRPNFMYIPVHYDQSDVEQYIPYLDVVPASIYTTWFTLDGIPQPHAWARWRMESTIQAIKSKASIGPNYLAGQKTPVGIVELFYEDDDPQHPGKPVMTAPGAYHDFWQAIVSGAQGMMVYSYFHRQDRPELDASWQILCQAVSQVSGPEQLGQVILSGENWAPASVTVTKGPTVTPSFAPTSTDSALINYPSVELLAKKWNNNLYVIVVNSADTPVTAKITGLPVTEAQAQILFKNDTLSLSQGVTQIDDLEGLGVRILKIPLVHPADPTGVSMDTLTPASAVLHWTAGNGGAPAIGFMISEYSVKALGQALRTFSASATSTSFTVPTQADRQRFYTVRAVTAASSSQEIFSSNAPFTLANTPSAPVVSSPTLSTFQVAIGTANDNQATTAYSLKLSTGKYIQATGQLGDAEVFATAQKWATTTVTGLPSGTTFTVTARAKNGDGVLTASSVPSGSIKTLGTVQTPPPSPNKNSKLLILHENLFQYHPERAPVPTPSFIKQNQAGLDGFASDLGFDGLAVYPWDNQGAIGLDNPEHDISGAIMNAGAVPYERIRNILSPLVGLTLNRLNNNFVFTVSNQPPDVFDDWSNVVNNFAHLARAAREVGLKGVAFDNEDYAKVWAFGPQGGKYPGKSQQQYYDQARKRGREVMAAMVKEFPDIVFVSTYGPWQSEPKISGMLEALASEYPEVTPKNPNDFADSKVEAPLYGPFFVGMVEAAGPQSTVVDGDENYFLRSDQQFQQVHTWLKNTIASDQVNSAFIPLALRPLWADHVSVGFYLYDKDNTDYLPMTPSVMEPTLTNALRNADRYVFLFTEGTSLLQGIVKPEMSPTDWVAAVRGATRSFGVKTLNLAPANPTAISVDSPTPTSAVVHWTPGSGGATVIDFTISEYKSKALGQALRTFSASATSTSFAISTKPNIQRFYTVRALAAASSTSQEVFSSNAPFTLANAPAAPTVLNPTTSTFAVAVTPGDDNSPATTYSLKLSNGRFIEANGDLGSAEYLATAQKWATTTVTGLPSGTTFTVTARAKNGDGVASAVSAPSAAIKTLNLAADNPLSNINYWAYQINQQDQNDSVAKLAASPYQLLVLNSPSTVKGNEDYDNKGDVTLLKQSKNYTGANKIVLSYIDVGEAEDYRTYWQKDWKPGSPEWIVASDPDGFGGNYPVKFWRPDWQNILKIELDKIIADGYDGIYLDWLEAYSFDPVAAAAKAEGKDPAQELIKFTRWIADYTRSKKPGFIIIAQNAAEMAQYPEYVKIFDAIAQESVWYKWAGNPDKADQPGDVMVNPDMTADLLANLKLWQKQGKPVFDAEYAKTFAKQAYQFGRQNNFKTYVSLVKLDQLTETPPEFPTVNPTVKPVIASTTYYVDAAIQSSCHSYDPATYTCGNGTAQAYQTIAEVNAGSFLPDDKILFRKGQVWHDNLLVPSSGRSGHPITFGSYGVGDKPKLDGADVFTGWTQSESNPANYYVTLPNWSPNTPNVVYQDGVPLVKKNNLDAIVPGSFYFTDGQKKLYISTTNGSAPSNHTIAVSKYPMTETVLVNNNNNGLITLDHKNNIVIDGLAITRSNYHGIEMYQSNNVTIQNCSFEYTYFDSVTAFDAGRNINVLNNTFAHNGLERVIDRLHGIDSGDQGVAVNFVGVVNGVIHNNTVQDEHGEGLQALGGSQNIEFSNNVVSNGLSYGIYISAGYGHGGDTKNITVTGNQLYNNGTHQYVIATEIPSKTVDAIDGVQFFNNTADGGTSCSGAGLLFGYDKRGPLKHISIHDNSFKNCYYGILAYGPTVDASNSFKNNILFTTDSGFPWDLEETNENNYAPDYDQLSSANSDQVIQWLGQSYALAGFQAAKNKMMHSKNIDQVDPANVKIDTVKSDNLILHWTLGNKANAIEKIVVVERAQRDSKSALISEEVLPLPTAKQYTVTGLKPNTKHIYAVRFEFKDKTKSNEVFADKDFYTLAVQAQSPILSNPTKSSFTLSVAPDGNTVETAYAVQVVKDSNGFFVGYLQADGTLNSVKEYFATADQWKNKTVIGLLPKTKYNVTLNSKNGDGITTDYTIRIAKITTLDDQAVKPAVPPVFAPLPAITRTADANNNPVFISNIDLGTATATSPAGGVKITRTGVPVGNLFLVGITTITYTAIDVAGNSATTTQTVTVKNGVVPAKPAPVVGGGGGGGGGAIFYSAPAPSQPTVPAVSSPVVSPQVPPSPRGTRATGGLFPAASHPLPSTPSTGSQRFGVQNHGQSKRLQSPLSKPTGNASASSFAHRPRPATGPISKRRAPNSQRSSSSVRPVGPRATHPTTSPSPRAPRPRNAAAPTKSRASRPTVSSKAKGRTIRRSQLSTRKAKSKSARSISRASKTKKTTRSRVSRPAR